MNCSIISVGTEILFGQIVNTNTVYLSKKLNELGLNVYHHFSVGDNAHRLKEILTYALSQSDLIITTGGLGPTQDDLTKETIAMVMGRALIRHENSYVRLTQYFKTLNRPMNENILKQVYLPKDSMVLPNDCGTAPGFLIEGNGKTIVSLPGPPKEMETMFENYLMNHLRIKSKSVIHSRVFKFFGIGEASVESKLIDLISNQSNPTIAPYAKEGEVSLRVTSKASDIASAEELLKPVVGEIRKRLGQYIYSCNDEELVEVAAKKILEKKWTISLAESCTGGLIASKLTTIPGISAALDRSIVTYSNKAKMQELSVKEKTLEKYGAVSEETAMEMVIGLSNKTGSDICIAVTGIAGPGGGTKDKPVGLVFIAMAYNGETICNRYNLMGGRDRIRNIASLLVFNMIRKTIG